jgi:MFS family permease
VSQVNPPATARGRSRAVIIFTIAAWSGYFVMALELLAGRITAPYFGTGIYVWGAVITIFMLALSAGYLLGGMLSTRNPRVSRLGGLLTIAALSALPVALLSEPCFEWIFDHVHDPRYGSLLGATLLFFIPTGVCGAISPYAVRLLVTQKEGSGSSAGRLYFVSTFGSAAGTIMTSFYLVLFFDVNQIVGGMIAISCVLGIATLGVRKWLG